MLMSQQREPVENLQKIRAYHLTRVGENGRYFFEGIIGGGHF